MGRATDVELVIRSIHEMLAAKERLTSPEKLSERLVESGWRRDRAVAAIERAVEQDDRLHIGRGRSLVYSGRDTAIYGRIGTLLHLWTPSSGWRVDDVIDCHARKDLRGFGDWQYPDLLVLADPRRRASADAPLELHAFEVEQRRGFSVQSVYQAFEQGRGANCAWVTFIGDELDKWKAVSGRSLRQRKGTGGGRKERIVRVASELGVGLILMGKVNARSSWRELVSPARRLTKSIAADDRRLLLRATGIAESRLMERSAR